MAGVEPGGVRQREELGLDVVDEAGEAPLVLLGVADPARKYSVTLTGNSHT